MFVDGSAGNEEEYGLTPAEGTVVVGVRGSMSYFGLATFVWL